MKIAMIGSGAAGSVFASYLKKGGAEEVWLVDPNKAHMDKVAKDGMIFRNPDGEFHVTGFKTAYSAEEVGVADIVIIMVKATITELALKGAMCCVGPETVVVTLQNGLGNEEVVKKLIPEERVMFGCGNMGTELPEPGTCVAKPSAGTENMYFGPCVKNELTDKVGKYLEEKFAAGGLLPHFYDDVRPKEVYDDPEGVSLVWSVWKEASDVAEALGIPGIWEYMHEEMPRIVKGLGDYYPSMAQDAQAHRQTEVDSLTGAISMFGRKVGIPTPTCDILTKEIKAIQANYERQY